MIEVSIDGLYQGNNLGGLMWGLNPLQCVSMGIGSMEMSDKLDPWMRSWLGDTLTAIEN